jgi:hypothetical protein
MREILSATDLSRRKLHDDARLLDRAMLLESKGFGLAFSVRPGTLNTICSIGSHAFSALSPALRKAIDSFHILARFCRKSKKQK